MEGESQLLTNFKAGTLSNLVFVVLFLVYKFTESHCKHSRCSSNTRWCKCRINTDDSNSEVGNKTLRLNVRSQKSLSELQKSDRGKIPKRSNEAV